MEYFKWIWRILLYYMKCLDLSFYYLFASFLIFTLGLSWFLRFNNLSVVSYPWSKFVIANLKACFFLFSCVNFLESISAYFVFCRCWIQEHGTRKGGKISRRFGVVQGTRIQDSRTNCSWYNIFSVFKGISREGSSSIHMSLLQYLLRPQCWWSNDWEKGKNFVH